MNDDDPVRGDGRVGCTRRTWLSECSVLVGGAFTAQAMPAGAQGLASAPASSGTASAVRTGRGQPTILVLGDSLSAEYGIARGSGWVALLSNRLAERYPRASIVNASISGETTAGGRTRLPALLSQHKPDLVVIVLGANDALRGMPLATTRANLVAMTTAARAIRAQVVLVGMQLPPNYGRRYGEEFAGLYTDVAKQEGTALVPFLLKGVADVSQAEAMFQADRIHPLATAHPQIFANVWPVLEPLVKARSPR